MQLSCDAKIDAIGTLIYAVSFLVVTMWELNFRMKFWKTSPNPCEAEGQTLHVNLWGVCMSIALGAVPIFNAMYVVAICAKVIRDRMHVITRKEKT